MKFGQHQSFYLRVNWLSKAMKMTLLDPRFFYDEYGFERIGLGKNMVKSLKYWASATSVLAESKNEENKPIHKLTELGSMLFAYDRFIRMPFTSAVLHSLLATNRDQATAWYWFFNEYNHQSSSMEELLQALTEWVQQHHKRAVSVHSLKKDLECLKQVYTIHSQASDNPEEVVVSPLSCLNLLYETKDLFVKRNPGLARIDIDALYFNLLLYCNKRDVNSVTLDELFIKPLLWGKIYHLTSSEILEALEIIQADPCYPVRFIRTNQIYSLNIEVEDAYVFLRKAYERKAAF